jgi:hypothetical protein
MARCYRRHDLLHNCCRDPEHGEGRGEGREEPCVTVVCCYGLLSDTRGTNIHLDGALAGRLGLILVLFSPGNGA